MNINLTDEILNANIQLVILAQNYIFNPNQMYMNGYYFKDCNVCIIFNV